MWLNVLVVRILVLGCFEIWLWLGFEAVLRYGFWLDMGMCFSAVYLLIYDYRKNNTYNL